MATTYVRVQEKGQVTIPRAIRRKMKLKKGDLVMFVETKTGVEIRPAEVVLAGALSEIGAALREKGITLEDMIERGREIRDQLTEEEYQVKDADE